MRGSFMLPKLMDVFARRETARLPVAEAPPAVPEIAAEIDVPLVPEAPVLAETAVAGEVAPAEDVSLVPEAPVAPQVPVTESEHFLAVLKAFREDAARGG